jgi:hypothetical protein
MLLPSAASFRAYSPILNLSTSAYPCQPYDSAKLLNVPPAVPRNLFLVWSPSYLLPAGPGSLPYLISFMLLPDSALQRAATGSALVFVKAFLPPPPPANTTSPAPTPSLPPPPPSPPGPWYQWLELVGSLAGGLLLVALLVAVLRLSWRRAAALPNAAAAVIEAESPPPSRSQDSGVPSWARGASERLPSEEEDNEIGPLLRRAAING